MVLVKIEPQPAILRSCDMVMAHYLPTRLETRLVTRYSGGRSELRMDRFPSKPKSCMLHVPEPRRRQNSALSFSLSRCLPLFHHLSVFLSALFSGVNQHRPSFLLACLLPSAWALSEHRASSPMPRGGDVAETLLNLSQVRFARAEM